MPQIYFNLHLSYLQLYVIFSGNSKKGEIQEEGNLLQSTLQKGLKNILSLSEAISVGNEKRPSDADFNFTNYAKNYKKGDNFSYVGIHLTIFDDNLNCQIDEMGSRARVFWIWQTFKCTPLYLNGQFTQEYYKLNGSNFQFMCEDSDCTNCRSLFQFSLKNT